MKILSKIAKLKIFEHSPGMGGMFISGNKLSNRTQANGFTREQGARLRGGARLIMLKP